MYRIDNATAVTPIPTPAAVGPNPNRFFSKGNPGGGIPATIVDDDWANAIQEEVANVVEAAGITLSKTVRTQLLTAITGGNLGRSRLTAATNFYVRTDGNDTNTGLVNNAGGAFLTIQGAVNALLKRWDMNAFIPTINIGAGSFAGWTVTGLFLGQTGIAVFNGAGGTTIITSSIIGSSGAAFRYQNMAVGTAGSSTVGSTVGAQVYQGAGVSLTGCQNSPQFSLLNTSSGGILVIEAAFTVANPGNIPSVFQCVDGGKILSASGGVLVTHTGTVTITNAYAVSFYTSDINVAAMTFTGTVTGPRFNVNYSSLIYTAGGGANFFPGNSAGTTGASAGTYA